MITQLYIIIQEWNQFSPCFIIKSSKNNIYKEYIVKFQINYYFKMLQHEPIYERNKPNQPFSLF